MALALVSVDLAWPCLLLWHVDTACVNQCCMFGICVIYGAIAGVVDIVCLCVKKSVNRQVFIAGGQDLAHCFHCWAVFAKVYRFHFLLRVCCVDYQIDPGQGEASALTVLLPCQGLSSLPY